MALRFHLDENVHGALAEALRRRGMDVTTASVADLLGATDDRHLAFARQQGRIVVTHDVDFLRLHAQGVEHAGIVFCHARRRSIRELVGALSLLAVSRTSESFTNRVEYV